MRRLKFPEKCFAEEVGKAKISKRRVFSDQNKLLWDGISVLDESGIESKRKNYQASSVLSYVSKFMIGEIFPEKQSRTAFFSSVFSIFLHYFLKTWLISLKRLNGRMDISLLLWRIFLEGYGRYSALSLSEETSSFSKYIRFGSTDQSARFAKTLVDLLWVSMLISRRALVWPMVSTVSPVLACSFSVFRKSEMTSKKSDFWTG